MRRGLVLSLVMAGWAVLGCGSVDEDAETSAGTCQDGQDNDADQAIDCADPDCARFVFCAPAEASAAECADGEDNDADQAIDCADPDCAVFAACAGPAEADAESCRNGADDDNDGDTDCADADCGPFCAAAELSHVACADVVDNDGDGDTDCADPDCAGLEYCSGAYGYPRLDAWRDVWDGWPRLAADIGAARADCEAAGGRLPTASEIYRNSGAPVGSRMFLENDWMWTFLADYQGSPVIVHSGDGRTDRSDGSVERTYRCVWPEETTAGFDRRRCLGPDGGECFRLGRENADAYERPPLDYVAASQECSFYGASLPVAADWGELTHAGIPYGTDNWLWNGNPTYGNEYGYIMTLSAFNAIAAPHWGFTNAYGNGTVAYATGRYNFRCVGLADPSAAALPADPPCEGECFQLSSRRSPLVADGEDRAAATWDVAVETCRADGGELPNQADFAELAHAGWAASASPLWMAHGNYWADGNYGVLAASLSGAGTPTWRFDNSGSLTFPTTSYSYRCIWRSRAAELPSCAEDEVLVDDGQALSCAPSVDGDSGGKANPGGTQIVDRFGNAWDTLQRTAAPYGAAVAACAADGARLPTASELWGARYGEPHGPPIGDQNSVSYLWTTTHSYDPGTLIVVRVSDGDAEQVALSSTQTYRCIWPATHGDALSGRMCYGPPGSACFTAAPDRAADALDRIALPIPAAIEECRAAGGHLPDLRDISVLTHAGWTNGSNEWLLVNDAVYWYSGGFGYLLARWLDAAPTNWSYGKATGNFGDITGFSSWYHFRCVYSTLNR
jgi:hypothetical protein